MKPQRIVILGMGRSGTTFLTEFLGRCGVYLDTVNWAQEHELARLINDTLLLREYGVRPGHPYGDLPKTDIQPSEYWQQLAAQFVAYMDGQANRHGAASWTFKDPRTTVLHKMWLDHFDIRIGIFRSPEEVVTSYLSQKWIRGIGARQRALGYWTRFNQSLLDIASQNPPTHILNYNQDMTAQTEALCARIGVTITPDAAKLFNRNQQHFQRPAAKRTPPVARLYQALVEHQLVKP